MGHRQLDPRLVLVAGLPVAVLAVLAGFALMVGADGGGSEAADALRSFGVLGFAGAVLGGLLLAVIGPRIGGDAPADDRGSSDGLETLTRATHELLDERLGGLTRAISESREPPSHPSFGLAGLPGSAGELGRLLDELDHGMRELAGVQREADRVQVADLVVNLVRRNQSLLDQQLEMIEDLESTEQQPDRLERLYGLDLLATRMRRNAESLLVLAGSEPPRRRNGPVPATDVVRVAVSEIQHYEQVEFGPVDEAVIAPVAVVDVAHLLSELLENAAAFSPPDANVVVGGSKTETGYRFTVSDAGIGMTAEQLEAANETLARPPELSLDLSRSLGLNVVGRLARRHGISVALLTPSSVGTEAVVEVPADLLVDPDAGIGPDVDGATAHETEASVGVGGDVGSASGDSIGEGALPERAAADGTADTDPLDDGVVVTPLAVRSRAQDPVVGTGTGESAAAGAEAADQATAATTGGEETDGEPGASDALARLLGVSPSEVPAAALRPPVEPAPAEPEEHLDDPGPVPDSLDEAVPTGADLDDGIQSLLGPGGVTIAPRADDGGAGLTRRDRSARYAPEREGRTIPETGTAATASNRSPAEIREMLARYRGARSTGSNPAGPDGADAAPGAEPAGPADGAADTTDTNGDRA